MHGEEGQEEDGEVRGEVKGEVEELREKRSSWMVWRWGDKLNGLEPMWSVMNDQTRNTKDSVQVCSILHVAHVGVRRVTLVIVHIGLKMLKVYLSLYTLLRSHFVRELLYQEVFSLHPPSVTVDCVDCYRYNHDKFCASNSC